MPDSGLEFLVGEEVSAVSFVRDYVEFHFDGPVLRALTNPVVETADGRWQFPALGSRDALCAAIGLGVQQVEFATGAHIRLTLAGGLRLTIPLDQASYIGPEAAHLVTPEGGVAVYE